VVTLLSALCFGALGCAPASAPAGEAEGSAARAEAARAVAIVDGAAIAADEVRRLAERDGLKPGEASRELVKRRLLIDEAERRGLGALSAVEKAERRALAQLVLRDLEREVGPDAVTEDVLRATYEAEREALAEPERRLVAWVRVEPQIGERLGDDGPALAEALLERMASEDLGALLRDFGEAPPAHEKYRYSVEEGLVVTPDPSGVSALRAAFFAAPSPGPLEAPIVTQRGAYAAFIIGVFPPRTPSLPQAEARLRVLALERLRAEALGLLIDGLRAEHAVRVDDAALAPLAGEAPDGAR
jgi:hypothetical protein